MDFDSTKLQNFLERYNNLTIFKNSSYCSLVEYLPCGITFLGIELKTMKDYSKILPNFAPFESRFSNIMDNQYKKIVNNLSATETESRAEARNIIRLLFLQKDKLNLNTFLKNMFFDDYINNIKFPEIKNINDIEVCKTILRELYSSGATVDGINSPVGGTIEPGDDSSGATVEGINSKLTYAFGLTMEEMETKIENCQNKNIPQLGKRRNVPLKNLEEDCLGPGEVYDLYMYSQILHTDELKDKLYFLLEKKFTKETLLNYIDIYLVSMKNTIDYFILPLVKQYNQSQK